MYKILSLLLYRRGLPYLGFTPFLHDRDVISMSHSREAQSNGRAEFQSKSIELVPFPL